MQHATLFRTYKQNQTEGDFFLFSETGKEIFKAKILELKYDNNLSNISCINEGVYTVKKVPLTTRIPYTHFEILGVSGRSGIKIHRGNYASQIKGCLLIGSAFSDINKDGNVDVIYSKKTLEKLLGITSEFVLTIKKA